MSLDFFSFFSNFSKIFQISLKEVKGNSSYTLEMTDENYSVIEFIERGFLREK